MFFLGFLNGFPWFFAGVRVGVFLALSFSDFFFSGVQGFSAFSFGFLHHSFFSGVCVGGFLSFSFFFVCFWLCGVYVGIFSAFS